MKSIGADAVSRQREMSRDWLWGLVLVMAVLLAYEPVWKAGYVWDDNAVITSNPVIVGPLGLQEIWTTSAADICPLTLTTFWLEYKLWGKAPLPYHLVNVMVHAACALILWRLLSRLRIPGAWLGAALWALHPVQVESVAWIVEMKNTQSGIFYLLAIYFFVRLPRPSSAIWAWTLNDTLVALFAAAAMASKSSTVILPFALCLAAWWMDGHWQWQRLAKLGPIFLMSLVTIAASMSTQGLKLESTDDPLWVRSWPERIATAGDAIWFYLGKLVWPQPLLSLYPRWQIDASQLISFLPLLALLVIWFIFWLNRATWGRPFFFAITYFVIALAPVLGLINLSFFHLTFVADHFQYLASMGPLALAGAGATRASGFVLAEKRLPRACLGAGLLLILGMLTWRQASIYENQETL